ncbi:ParB N-terminal domain-containing protein [Sinomonas sp. P47F7]|uniref:ParB N-terminal domain-containing protein n=1 Tax=Sinomonas sp. P47F7 TaxID=3410987 RepID=UPI003BF4D788
MGRRPGHIELERALDSIRVGRRHRGDLGDVGALAASIEREGLLQPITVAPDGVLVCGLRRLAAMRQLGWKTANVWVRSGISDELGQLLAEQDDNALHKPLSQTEQAALYRELKTLLAEDAARRQMASRFPADGQTRRSDGAATVAAPSTESQLGDTRAQAALMVTGRNSYTSLERIGELQRLAADLTAPTDVRRRAAAELAGIDAGGSITAAHQRARAEVSLAELDRLAGDPTVPAMVRGLAAQDAARLRASEPQARAADLEHLAAEALARVRAGQKRTAHPRPAAAPGAGVMTVRAFVLIWEELAGWWERCDPAEVAAALTDEQWERFQNTVAGTIKFAESAAAARAKSEPRTA